MILQGRLEFAETTVRGWALDEDALDNFVTIRVVVNEKSLFIVANVFREDLLSVFGSTHHGFEFDISPFLNHGQNKIVCEFSDTGEVLNNGVQTFNFVKTDFKVYAGNEGWLFLQNDSNKVIEQLFGLHKFTEADERKLRCDVYVRKLIADNLGSQTALIITPEKHVVYENKFSHARFISNHRYAIEFARIYESEMSNATIYPVEELKKASLVRNVYHKTDTHMNSHGALEISKLIADRFDISVGYKESDFDTQDVIMIGDLGSKLSPPTSEMISQLKPKSGFRQLSSDVADRFEFNITRTGGHILFLNENVALGQDAVFFGTSSLFFQAEVFASLFRKSLFVWTNKWDISLLKCVKPKYIVSIMTERVLPMRLGDGEADLPRSIKQAVDIWSQV